jgi:pimeloyl-ACP methyl ester carboxylesterase
MTCRSCTASRASGGCRNGWSTGCRASRTHSRYGVGNAAAEQEQIEVYGEVTDALHQARKHIWCGDADWIGSDHGRWYARHLEDAKLTLVPGAGHLLPRTYWRAILSAAVEG